MNRLKVNIKIQKMEEIGLDNNLENIKEQFENGTISISDLTEEQINSLSNYYKNEIEQNKNEMKELNQKIKELKKKIDNIV